MNSIKRKFCHFILLGHNVTQAALLVGRSKASGHRWIREPEVKEYIAELEAVSTTTALARMVGLYERAIDELGDALDAGGSTSLQAARFILDRLPLPTEEATTSGWDESQFDRENL